MKGANMHGFQKPVCNPVQMGVFRSIESGSLKQLDFDRKRLGGFVNKILDNLPQGAAIVGGFARGMLLGDFSKVGDLDIFYPKPQDWSWHSKSLQVLMNDFLCKMRYRTTYRSTYDICFCNELRRMTEIKYLLPVVSEGNELYFGRVSTGEREGRAEKWNVHPITPKLFHFWQPPIDISLANTDSLEILVNKIDISITQICYLDGLIYATELAIQDLERGQFHLLIPERTSRVEKYIQKGFKFVEAQP